MKYHKVKCPICEAFDNYKVLYPGNVTDSDFNTQIFSARRLPDKIHYRIVQCITCGLVRSDPIADTHVLGKLYSTSLFTYDNEVKSLKITYMEALNNVLPKLNKKVNILEIGCGNGFVMEEIYKLGYKNIYGVEPSKDAVGKANPTIKKNIVIEMYCEESFPGKKFDLIFLFQTFDHLSNPNKLFRSIHKKLNSHGYMLAFNHDIGSESSKFLGERSPIIDIEHPFLYDHKTIAKLLQKNHFRVEKIYSPYNYLSLNHLIKLLPLPNKIKLFIIDHKFNYLNKVTRLKIGNLCVIAKKL